MKAQAAFFDVDRTLVPGHSMERVFVSFLWRTGYLRTADFGRYLTFMAKNIGKDMAELIHHNKLHFRNKNTEEINILARTCFQKHILPLVSDQGRRAVEDHRKKGHLVVILTGSLEPLAKEITRELQADICLATELKEEQGVLNGSLANERPYGPEKARLVRHTAQQHGLDLQKCFAYGDHHSDVDLLAAVGFPRAVNPHPGLKQEAKKRGWPIVRF